MQARHFRSDTARAEVPLRTIKGNQYGKIHNSLFLWITKGLNYDFLKNRIINTDFTVHFWILAHWFLLLVQLGSGPWLDDMIPVGKINSN